MTEKQDDRRTQRSKQMLFNALSGLMGEKPFDKITVQEIIDRANVGRTTFYAHFQSKEDLFISSHERIIVEISLSFFAEPGSPDPLRSESSTGLINFLQLSQQSRDTYFYLTWGSTEILQRLKTRAAEQIVTHLRERFNEAESRIPFVVLSHHIAGSMITLLDWWMNSRSSYTAQDIAAMIHQMNIIVLRDALRG